MSTLDTACMRATYMLTVHVRGAALHSVAAFAHRKRRRHLTAADGQREVLSEAFPAVAVA